jgi:hypothetical protein
MTFCIYHDFGISWCVQIYGKSRMFVHDGLGFYALSSDPDIEKHSDGKCWTPTIQYFRKMLHPDVSKYVRPWWFLSLTILNTSNLGGFRKHRIPRCNAFWKCWTPVSKHVDDKMLDPDGTTFLKNVGPGVLLNVRPWWFSNLMFSNTSHLKDFRKHQFPRVFRKPMSTVFEMSDPNIGDKMLEPDGTIFSKKRCTLMFF